jgi:hypothetical protein
MNGMGVFWQRWLMPDGNSEWRKFKSVSDFLAVGVVGPLSLEVAYCAAPWDYKEGRVQMDCRG